MNHYLLNFPIIIFAGSVFISSGKFVDTTNTPKFYFVAASLMVAAAFSVIYKKRINLSIFSSRITLWSISITCLLQACWGLTQLVGWPPFNYSTFAVTGSFDNPAGFAAVLAMGYPISLFFLNRAKIVEKYFTSVILIVFAIAIYLSGSRTGMLAIIISSMIFLLFKAYAICKLLQLRYFKLLTVILVISLMSSVFILYLQKKDSANGRLLIWKISSEMIKEKPILGHGYGAFQAKYMNFQAEHFKNNPLTKYSNLADNVKHPFNEFIKVAVEFGLIGLVFIFSSILFVLWKIMKSKNENNQIVVVGLASFLVLACFSYPLQYISIWILLAFYFSFLLPRKEIKLKNTPISILLRSSIVIVCLISLFYIFQHIHAEIKWKTIAVNSLRGNTEEMLPEYKKLYSTTLKRNSFFLYNYGAELNFKKRFDESIDILTICEKRFNDYDLQMLLADNYYKKGNPEKAIQIYKHASNMIPCRFLPLYQIFEIHKKRNQKDMAVKYALEIKEKNVKIPSLTVNSIKAEVEEYLRGNESTIGNRVDGSASDS